MLFINGQLLNAVKHQKSVRGVALQPSSNVDVFVTTSDDRVLRLFDVRHSLTGMMCRHYLLLYYSYAVFVF